jgi:hypothetical protein
MTYPPSDLSTCHMLGSCWHWLPATPPAAQLKLVGCREPTTHRTK